MVSSKLDELKNINNLPFDAESLATSQLFDDTNKIFEPPIKVNKHITKFLNDEEIKNMAEEIKSKE